MFFSFKVTAFSPGDYVRILDSVQSLVQLQADHGEWTPEMNGAAGKIGRVIKVRFFLKYKFNMSLESFMLSSGLWRW